MKPTYVPQTVNLDGWKTTHNAWRRLFAGVVLVLCFLHGFLKIRDRGRKLFQLDSRIWEVYRWGGVLGQDEGVRCLVDATLHNLMISASLGGFKADT